MGDVYRILESLLQERGISGGKMSADLGMSRSFMTELRKGRAKSITADTAKKIANYFDVSVEYLLGEDTEKAPTTDGERNDDERLKAAFFEGADPSLTKDEIDELWQDAKDYMFIKIQQRKMKRD